MFCEAINMKAVYIYGKLKVDEFVYDIVKIWVGSEVVIIKGNGIGVNHV